MTPETLLLTRADVRALLDMDACIAAVEDAFRAHAERRTIRPGVLGVDAPPRGVFHVKAAGVRGATSYYAAKVNANFPGNPRERGTPSIQGLMVLFDADAGAPIAVMDSVEVTSLRTAAATGVAAKYLALPDASVATIAGCGVQGRSQLLALSRVRELRSALAFDRDADTAAVFAREMSTLLGIPVQASSDLASAVRASDMCVTCTPSRQAIVGRDAAHPGLFIAGVGADNHDKQELDVSLLASSTVVVDVLEQCVKEGDLHHAIEAGAMRAEDVHGELADVVSGKRPGRTSREEVTVFDSTGTALEDVAAAAVVYERALATGRGVRLSFLD
ncbi:MAG TPA: ornithine cyclodeaminase family protein [Gemmatimonadaceae bacterium]|nr:ornithine cyclodeaminase family protein [Gemmatimonadaceae bacterium]